ncbi:MAG TPA: type II toxin-antitoxin system prevent-host-death family antitoxin [Rhizomicrobium sp.]|nr:type II toxin-antitoxin system prevent-host-death family antitoxin [Rhizomicrobium sp.]
MKVNVLEAKNRLSQLIKAAQAGEEVIIANRGEPVVRLVPVKMSAEDELPLGHPKRVLAALDANRLPEHRRRSAEEIDAGIEEERNAWD